MHRRYRGIEEGMRGIGDIIGIGLGIGGWGTQRDKERHCKKVLIGYSDELISQ